MKVLGPILNSKTYSTELKCLVIFYQKSNTLKPIDKILDLANRHLLPNFGVLQVLLNKTPKLFTYNFASLKTEMQNWNSKCFPNKMKDLNGKKVKVAVQRPWPSSYVNNGGLPLHLVPQVRMFKVYKLAAKFLNFTSTTYVVLKSNEKRPTTEILIYDNILMYLMDGYGSCISVKSGETLYVYSFDNLVAMVPIKHENKLKASMKILYSFSSIVAMILTIVLFFKFSRGQNQGWSFLNIFNLMFGYAVTFQPRSFKSKIVFFILLMFSIFFTSDLVSDLTEISIVNEERLLASSIEEIVEKKISVICRSNKEVNAYLFAPLKGTAFYTLMMNANSKLSFYEKQKRNEVEFELNNRAEEILYRYQLSGDYDWKILDIDQATWINTLIFRPNSPFLSKYMDIDKRVSEFVLDVKWARDLKVERPVDKPIDLGDNNEVLPAIIIGVLIFGSSISFITFLFELIWNLMSNKFSFFKKIQLFSYF